MEDGGRGPYLQVPQAPAPARSRTAPAPLPRCGPGAPSGGRTSPSPDQVDQRQRMPRRDPDLAHRKPLRKPSPLDQPCRRQLDPPLTRRPVRHRLLRHPAAPPPATLASIRCRHDRILEERSRRPRIGRQHCRNRSASPCLPESPAPRRYTSIGVGEGLPAKCFAKICISQVRSCVRRQPEAHRRHHKPTPSNSIEDTRTIRKPALRRGRERHKLTGLPNPAPAPTQSSARPPARTPRCSGSATHPPAPESPPDTPSR